MKTAGILATVLFFSSSFLSLRAQEKPFAMEVRGGVNFTKMHHSLFEVNGQYGYRFDAIADYRLPKTFFLRSGLTFSSKNTEKKLSPSPLMYYPESNGYYFILIKSTAYYIQIPLMIGYRKKFGKIEANFAGGSYLACGLGGKNNDYGYSGSVVYDGVGDIHDFTPKVNVTHIEEPSFTDVYKRFDNGLIVSLGVRNKVFSLNAGYEFGLQNIRQSGAVIQKNRTAFLSLGFIII
jgi:hypothetical protein